MACLPFCGIIHIFLIISTKVGGKCIQGSSGFVWIMNVLLSTERIYWENMSIKYKVIDDLRKSHVNDFYNSFYNARRTDSEFQWEFCNSPFGEAIYI